MRACVQRVNSASVTVDDKVIGEIGRGLFVLLGVATDDTDADVKYLANKILGLRVFADDEDKMNLSVEDIAGGILVVSQFTLLGDCRKGRRPSFIHAALPEPGERLYEQFVGQLRLSRLQIATGQFGAMMDISLVNHGPVTLLIDSKKNF